VLYPALAEEWLNRGVLWVALERIAKPATVILCTAFAFAVMHGLNGGRYLELPHRFAGGLLLGWLRHRTGSLAPPIAGHATLNLIACLME
jgi:sodium transport system permease protein